MIRTTLPLVGLIGKKRSGKDTAAGFLVERHGFTRHAFADPLKTAALGLDPLIRVEMDEKGILYGPGAIATRPSHERLSTIVEAVGWERAKEIREVRRTLQHYGVAVREIRPDFWVRATLDPALAAGRPVVVTDVRFPNEADEIEARGGVLVRIVRPDAPAGPGAEHISETALDDRRTPLRILNSGTLDDLANAASIVADYACRA
jgi:hypothetical protein